MNTISNSGNSKIQSVEGICKGGTRFVYLVTTQNPFEQKVLKAEDLSQKFNNRQSANEYISNWAELESTAKKVFGSNYMEPRTIYLEERDGKLWFITEEDYKPEKFSDVGSFDLCFGGYYGLREYQFNAKTLEFIWSMVCSENSTSQPEVYKDFWSTVQIANQLEALETFYPKLATYATSENYLLDFAGGFNVVLSKFGEGVTVGSSAIKGAKLTRFQQAIGNLSKKFNLFDSKCFINGLSSIVLMNSIAEQCGLKKLVLLDSSKVESVLNNWPRK
ncbi:MAG: hypothetical protein ACRCXZ_00360 [Patescibacteria group bacterium]